jgi:hypothetical protein
LGIVVRDQDGYGVMIIRKRSERICKSSSSDELSLAEGIGRNRFYPRKQGVIEGGMRVRIKKRFMRDLWVMKM